MSTIDSQKNVRKKNAEKKLGQNEKEIFAWFCSVFLT